MVSESVTSRGPTINWRSPRFLKLVGVDGVSHRISRSVTFWEGETGYQLVLSLLVRVNSKLTFLPVGL